MLSYMAIALRWQRLLRAQKIELKYAQAFRLTLIGLFFSFALPGGVSGDVVKAYYIAQHKADRRMTAIASIGIDRLFGVVAMLGLALTVMSTDLTHVLASPEVTLIYYSVATLFLTLILLCYFLFSQSGFHSTPMKFVRRYFIRVPRASQLLEIAHGFGREKGVFTQSLAISIIGQILGTLMFLYAGHLIEPNVRWTTYFFCVPIGMIVTAIPISPGGVGVGQAAFYFLFNLYLGQKSDLGPTLMTIYQMFCFICGIAGAIFYLQHRSSHHHEQQPEA